MVNKRTAWIEIRQKILDISGKLLKSVVPFDVYCSKSMGLDKHSVGIRLVFQSADRTLVDVEIDALVRRIVVALEQDFSAVLRG